MEREPEPQQRKATAVSLLVLVNVLWGVSFPITKTIGMEVDDHFNVGVDGGSARLRFSAATWLIQCRFAAALLIFAIFFPSLVRRAKWGEWRAGSVIGIFFFIGLVLQIIGLASIPASRSGFLTSLVAVFTPLLTALLLRMRPRLHVLAGVAVALLGVAVLTELIEVSPRGISLASDALSAWTFGDTLTTLGAVFFAGQIMLVDYYGKRLDAAALTPGMFLSTAVLAAVAFVLVAPSAPESAGGGWVDLAIQPRFWSLLLVLSVFSSVLAFGLMNSYQHYVSASQAGVIYTLEPVFASAAAMVLPGLISAAFAMDYANERLVWPMAVGGGLIVVANLISLWPTEEKR